jgi:hypothetical protein
MRRTSAGNVSQGKGHALSRHRSGELTCSESQVDEAVAHGGSSDFVRKEFKIISKAANICCQPLSCPTVQGYPKTKRV